MSAPATVVLPESEDQGTEEQGYLEFCQWLTAICQEYGFSVAGLPFNALEKEKFTIELKKALPANLTIHTKVAFYIEVDPEGDWPYLKHPDIRVSAGKYDTEVTRERAGYLSAMYADAHVLANALHAHFVATRIHLIS